MGGGADVQRREEDIVGQDELLGWVANVEKERGSLVEDLQSSYSTWLPPCRGKGKARLAKEVLKGTTVREGWKCADVWHGFYIERSKSESDDGLMVGRFSNGKKVGVHWKRQEGGLWLVGALHPDTGQMDGEAVVLYPDLKTVLAAQFEAGKLVVGWEGRVGGVSKHLGIPWPQVVDMRMEQGFSYQPSTSNCISTQPLLR